ncbi:hypothetical protein GCM10010199_47260 [Dactylosporangium roseum]
MYVTIGEVAEHAGEDDQIDGDRMTVRGEVPGICLNGGDPLEPGRGDTGSGGGHVAGVMLDQLGPHPIGVRPLREDADEVMALPGAHADHPKRGLWPLVNPVADVLLDEPEPSRQR